MISPTEGHGEITKANAGNILSTSLKNLTLKDLEILLEAKKKESIEDMELEDKNFRVEDISDRTEIIDHNGVKTRQHPKGDAREYIEGKCTGEQLFTRNAALRETKKAGKRLPLRKIYESILMGKYKGNIKAFIEGEKIPLTGTRGPKNKRFYSIHEKFFLRCEDNCAFDGYERDHRGMGDYAASVRCCK